MPVAPVLFALHPESVRCYPQSLKRRSRSKCASAAFSGEKTAGELYGIFDRRCIQQIDHRPGADTAMQAVVWIDGSDGWVEQGRIRQIVKARDQHIIRDLDPVIFKGGDHNHCDLVIGADKSIGEISFLGKVPCDLGSF